MGITINPYLGNYPDTATDLVWATAQDRFDNLPTPATEACTPEISQRLAETHQHKRAFVPELFRMSEQEFQTRYTANPTMCRTAQYWMNLAAVYPAGEHQDQAMPSLALLTELEETWQQVKAAHDIVVQLKALPHEDGDWAGVEHRYNATTWTGQVLPLVGNMDRYKATIMDAAEAFRALMTKYDDLKFGACVSTGGLYGVSGTTNGIINLSHFPTLLRPTVQALTLMMGEIVDFQVCDKYKSCAQIECAGAACPEMDESDDFATPYASAVCYLTHESADRAVCYRGSVNPYLEGFGFMLVGMWMWDTRTGETEFTNFYSIEFGGGYEDPAGPQPLSEDQHYRWTLEAIQH